MSYRKLDIQQWLKELFNEDVIPPFDETEETMELLMEIMNKNKDSEKDMRETIKIQKSLSEMYDKKSDELASLLDNENLPLSLETLDRVENIASVANSMHLKEPSLTNFLLAITDVEDKKMKNKEKELILDHHIATLSRKVTKTRKMNETLKRDLEVLEETVESQEKRELKVKANTSFLKSKSNEYISRIKGHEQHLSNIGCEPSLYHNQLDKKNKDIKELNKTVDNLKSKLQSYQNLPPNELLARVKIHEMELELSALEEEFRNLLEIESKHSAT